MKRGVLLTIVLAACSPKEPPKAPAPAARPAARTTTTAPGSAAAAARPSSALDSAMAADLAADRAIPWSSTWRLTWANFQGRPPTAGNEGARTAYGLYYAWSCKGERFGFRVVAGFHPTRSWVKQAVVKNPAENARVLRHEQTHFDITEVFARRLRKELGSVSRPCAQSDAALKAIARRIVDEERRTQQRYDSESNHGLIENRQADWNFEVAKMLQAVERYAQ